MLYFFPRGVLDEILNLIESVSEGFPSYSCCSVCREFLCAFVSFYLFFFSVCKTKLVDVDSGKQKKIHFPLNPLD